MPTPCRTSDWIHVEYIRDSQNAPGKKQVTHSETGRKHEQAFHQRDTGGNHAHDRRPAPIAICEVRPLRVPLDAHHQDHHKHWANPDAGGKGRNQTTLPKGEQWQIVVTSARRDSPIQRQWDVGPCPHGNAGVTAAPSLILHTSQMPFNGEKAEKSVRRPSRGTQFRQRRTRTLLRATGIVCSVKHEKPLSRGDTRHDSMHVTFVIRCTSTWWRAGRGRGRGVKGGLCFWSAVVGAHPDLKHTHRHTHVSTKELGNLSGTSGLDPDTVTTVLQDVIASNWVE